MPLYKYEYLEVTCLDKKRFRLDQMREAVEYLKQQPQTKYVGLSAMTQYQSKKYRFRLQASPMIHLEKIIGRTPKEVWEMFDADVTRQIKYHEDRLSSNVIRNGHHGAS